jgi:peptide/nickel transport system ATP-binding protein
VTDPILSVEDLRTYFRTDSGIVRAVDGVTFQVFPGETLGVVGESGSGKSVMASSVMRLIPEPGRIVGGRIRFRGQDVTAMGSEEIRELRGGSISMVFQDPMTSLNPVLRISTQLDEAMLAHHRYDQHNARRRSLELLRTMGISAPERAIRSYPHQFSGGMRQRVMLAMGFSNDPQLLIADEPTTALDVTIQAQILDLLRVLNTEFQVAIILISHDLGVVANLCSRVIVMYAGQIVEEGSTESLLGEPEHPYTWALLNAVPRADRDGQHRLTSIEGSPPDLLTPSSGCRFQPRCPFRIDKCAEMPPLLEISPGRWSRCWVTQGGARLLSPADEARAATPIVETPIHTGNSEVHADRLRRPVAPFAIPPAASRVTVAAARKADPVAEASGVTPAPANTIVEFRGVSKWFPVTGGWLSRSPAVVHALDNIDLAIATGETLGLVGESGSGKSTLGRLIVRLYEPTAGEVRFEGRDISHLGARGMRPLRQRMQMIFQDPYSSLNSRMRVGAILEEPLKVHGLLADARHRKDRVAELLSLVGLRSADAKRYPHEFSGGQRQRIGIARALAVGPRFIVADEPISSLDVNIQAQIINLLEDLQARFDLTFLFIAHDLSVVRHVSDRIAVLYLGKIAEIAATGDLYERPLHPYTQALISAVPIPDARVERQRRRIRLTGEIPSSVDPPSGCRFRTRCPIAQQICAEVIPPLLEHRPGQWAACHFPGKL